MGVEYEAFMTKYTVPNAEKGTSQQATMCDDQPFRASVGPSVGQVDPFRSKSQPCWPVSPKHGRSAPAMWELPDAYSGLTVSWVSVVDDDPYHVSY